MEFSEGLSLERWCPGPIYRNDPPGAGFSGIRQVSGERNQPPWPHPSTHPHSNPNPYPTTGVIILARKSQGEIGPMRDGEFGMRNEETGRV